MWLRFHRIRKGVFGDGRDKLLVDFTDAKNVAAGNWCPKWHEVENLVISAVEVEQTNDSDYVEMLRKMEEQLARRLPKLGIARHDALMHSYEPPNVETEILDRDQPGWGPRRSLRLTCLIPQRLLDLVIENGLRVHLVVREEKIADVRLHVGSDEVSLTSLSEDDVELVNGHLWRRKPSPKIPPF